MSFDDKIKDLELRQQQKGWNRDRARMIDKLRDAWMKLPKEIHVWRKAVSNACMVGEL